MGIEEGRPETTDLRPETETNSQPSPKQASPLPSHFDAAAEGDRMIEGQPAIEQAQHEEDSKTPDATPSHNHKPSLPSSHQVSQAKNESQSGIEEALIGQSNNVDANNSEVE